MYSKDQASQLKQAFWTTFGQYIAPQLSAEGLRVNWINYKTGLKNLFFKMQADGKSAYIAIELTHADPGMQELLYEQFREFRRLLENQLEEEWDWQLHTQDEYGKTITRIGITLQHVSIFKQEDWPALISFFKPRIIALDEFWTDVKDAFEVFK
ncbi:DUF4268 domain-containing protein [Pedobacter sp. GR22-6]|uniref:DUF4268 domain-containing protein n=1 Tax=Pedobacter sp. GR22-6 TaxID=3127957 RepID=UPI00307DAF4A